MYRAFRRLSSRCLAVAGVVVGLAGAGCTDSASETSEAADPVYRQGAPSGEAGTGRFYMGREIARVLGHPAADWMDRPGREAQELPNRVVVALDLDSADVVADIGAGTGYFTFRISPLVPQGRVYAVDIEPEMLDLIRRRIVEHRAANVVPVQGKATDPNLPPEAVDVALIVDAYHEFSHPREMMEGVSRALVPGGRLVLVEYRGEDETLPIDPLHRMTEEQARREMRAVGLEWRETLSILPQQHILVFEKPLR